MLLAAMAWAQPPAAENPPRFDFEADVDGDRFPDGWQLVGTRHPENVRERLDTAEHHSGAKSFLVAPDGQPCVYETVVARPFDPRLSWRLTGWIKTSGLPASGLRATSARVEAALLGAEGEPPVRIAATPGVTGTANWTQVSIDIPRDVTCAARLVRLRLVVEGAALEGKAWFDDVAFEPRPTVRMSCGKVDGFYHAGEPAKAAVLLDTLLGDGFRLATKLTGPDGVVVESRSADVKPGLDFAAEAAVDLPFRAFGLYRLDAELTCAGKPVVSTARTVIYLRAPAGPSREIGIAGSRAEVIALAGAGTATVDIFSDEPARIAERFARLRELGIEPVAVLGRVPDSVVRRLFKEKLIADESEATWPRVLALDPATWSEELLAAVKPVATRASHYQLGLRAEPGLSPESLKRAVTRLRETLAPLTWERKIALPTDGTETDGALSAGADVLVLQGPGSAERIEAIRKNAAEVWVEAPVTGDGKGLAERLRRVKAAGAARAIVGPLEGGLLNAKGEPTEAFFALVNR